MAAQGPVLRAQVRVGVEVVTQVAEEKVDAAGLVTGLLCECEILRWLRE